MRHLPLSAESVVDNWIRFQLDEVSCQWLATMELNNEKKQDPFYSEEYNCQFFERQCLFFLQGLTNDLGSFPPPPPPSPPRRHWAMLSFVRTVLSLSLSLSLSPPQTLLLALAGYPDEKSNNLKKIRKRSGDDAMREKAVQWKLGKP